MHQAPTSSSALCKPRCPISSHDTCSALGWPPLRPRRLLDEGTRPTLVAICVPSASSMSAWWGCWLSEAPGQEAPVGRRRRRRRRRRGVTVVLLGRCSARHWLGRRTLGGRRLGLALGGKRACNEDWGEARGLLQAGRRRLDHSARALGAPDRGRSQAGAQAVVSAKREVRAFEHFPACWGTIFECQGAVHVGERCRAAARAPHLLTAGASVPPPPPPPSLS